MNYTQNRKIMQVTETTLVVGVDIGSQYHYARAFDWRGIEITRKAFRFSIARYKSGERIFTSLLNKPRRYGTIPQPLKRRVS